MEDVLIIALGVFVGEAVFNAAMSLLLTILRSRHQKKRLSSIIAMRDQMVEEYEGHAENITEG